MNFSSINQNLDKIQGDKKSLKRDRLEMIDEISNQIAVLPDSIQRTKILKRCSVLAHQIEFDLQSNLV